jgi:ABC-type Fe3+-hydroxamate transport system substrate-binding protein
MNKKLLLPLFAGLIVLFALAACSASPAATPTQSTTPVTPVKISAHPTTLDGMTVVLRWNSKPNGDLYLNHLADLLTAQYKGIKVIKLWQTEPDTAKISSTDADSAALADKIAALKPDLVIAAQAD